MNALSLFTGIGGIDLGLEAAGMRIVGQAENDAYCRKVLTRHWPDVPLHNDVLSAYAAMSKPNAPRIDVVAGGFPCQDISTANTRARAGLAGAKSSLWFHMFLAVKAARPRWVLVENSPNWKGWTPRVRNDLEQLGYNTTAAILAAGQFGAPHRRPRCWVVADSHGQGESLRAIDAEVARLRPIPGHAPTAVSGAVGSGDGVPHRVDRLRTLGNAVVPQVAEHVGRLIVAHDEAARDAA